MTNARYDSFEDSKSSTSTKEKELLYQAIMSIDTTILAKNFLHDILSPAELDSLAQRLEVARMLNEGASYLETTHKTGASSTTVSRVSKCLNGPEKGYAEVLTRLKSQGNV